MNIDPKIVAAFREFEWPYAPVNEEAIVELERRLYAAASKKSGNPVIYSEWVNDVDFVVPKVNAGRVFRMSTEEWAGRYRDVIGATLGLINARSYEAHGILLSSMAVAKRNLTPGKRFIGLAKDVGLYRGKSNDDALTFWIEQMTIVRDFVAANPPGELVDLAALIVYITEGAEKVKEVLIRERCAKLAAAARAAHRSKDGLLRCSACGWHKPEGPIVGDIVQLHHLDPVANAPKKGRRVNLADAKQLFIPLCPNCHCVSHSLDGGGLLTLENLFSMMRLAAQVPTNNVSRRC